ncbi:MAG: pantetheine-phosphate adenylyltransferase [Deltaproteobacteria bacterium]|nr:pantetheine-phosphate adenylyltransferase [Deltaproteobacteria bacterium]MBW2070371.1 pantetheine-phosphate adenylyltransferase [Deltaproteobacteria bacterium]
MKLAVYPGSFDPITYGHLDILDRGLKIFDKIIIALAENPAKKPLLTLQERLELIKQSLIDHREPHRIEVESFRGLLVDYVEATGAVAILRGLRAVSDFEYEFQMALMNRKLSRRPETLYLMTGARWIYISSRIIKEVVESGGCVTGLVPPVVEQKLQEKFPDRPRRR